MLCFLTQEVWHTKISAVRLLKFTEQPQVIAAIANAFNLQTIYLIFEEKNKPIISLIAYTKGKKIINPSHYFYANLWVDETLSDAKYTTVMLSFLTDLKKKYHAIDLQLPITIKDVRPFLWANFLINNRYTYIKNLANLTYHPVIKRKIKNFNHTTYSFKLEELTELSVQLNLKIFKELGTVPVFAINKIENLLKNMANTPHLICCNCYENEDLLASNILFLDPENKTAFTALLNQTNKANKNDLHVALYNFFFTELKKQGYEYVDMLGADMENIATFKGSFKPELMPNFLVSYSKNKQTIYSKISLAKSTLKKIWAKFN